MAISKLSRQVMMLLCVIGIGCSGGGCDERLVDRGESGPGQIARFEVAEMAIGDDETAYENPFVDVECEGVLVAPSGRRYKVPGFYDGEGVWRVRFVGLEVGRWAYTLTLKGESKTAHSTGFFTVSDARTAGDAKQIASHGPVRVAPDVPTRLVHYDGSPYHPIGTALWPFGRNLWLGEVALSGDTESQLHQYFAAYADSGANVHRSLLRMGRQAAVWNGSSGPDRCDLAMARQWDLLVQTGYAHNHLFILVLYNKLGVFERYPLHVNQGGRLSDPNQLFSDSWAQEKHRQYIRYVVARYHPYVAVWQLFNEVGEDDMGTSEEWRAKTAEYIRGLDPLRRPVNTSTINVPLNEEWEDALAPHYYSGNPWHRIGNVPVDAVAVDLDMKALCEACTPGKPIIIDEFGNGYNLRTNDEDKWRVALWTAFFFDGGIVFWDERERSDDDAADYRGKGRRNANAFISDRTRANISHLHRFLALLSPGLVQREGYALRSESQNARVWWQGSDLAATYAAYVHAAQHHEPVTDFDLVYELPPEDGLEYEALFFDPKTGTLTDPVPVPAGEGFLRVPPFTQDLAVLVRPRGLSLVGGELPSGKVGEEYFYRLRLRTRGGEAPLLFSLAGDPGLPDGLRLEESTGLIHGWPSREGTYRLAFRVEGAHGRSAEAVVTLTVK